MSAPSIIAESDITSTTVINSSAENSGFPSPTSTNTSHSDAPLIRQPALSNNEQANAESSSPGWPHLAEHMATVPEFQTFSRFRELNVKNLLYYQVEITQLSEKLRKQELKDWKKRGMGDAGKYSKRAEELFLCKDNQDNKQLGLILDIRERLKEYNTALLQHVQVSALPEPDNCNVESLRAWISRPDCGNFCIAGRGSEAWGDLYERPDDPDPFSKRIKRLLLSIFWVHDSPPKKPDLVATHPHRNIDGFTRWIEDEWIPFYHGCRTSMNEKGDVEKDCSQDANKENFKKYSEKTMLRFTSSVATVVACILPTLAISILTTAHGTLQILLYIGGFTTLFAIGLMFLTNAETTRVEIFTATAAFSAVLVVFVQNQ